MRYATKCAASSTVPGMRTIAQILDFYISDIAELCELGQRSIATLGQYRSLRTNAFGPILGRPADEVSPIELRRWLRWAAKRTRERAQSKGGEATANAALRLLKIALKEAEALGVLPRGSSPARYVRELRARPRDRYLSPEELRSLWAALAREEANRRRHGKPVTPVEAIRLLALTGQRYKEILRLRWSEVELRAAVIRLERTKTGPREVALSDQAVRVLARQHRRSGGGEFVFPSQFKPERPLTSVDHCWRKVREAAGLNDGKVVMHTLRHTLATLGHRDGEDLERISEALGHASTDITRRVYCRPLATPGARALMERHAQRFTD